MTYNVLVGMLNPTHSIIHSTNPFYYVTDTETNYATFPLGAVLRNAVGPSVRPSVRARRVQSSQKLYI